MTLTATPSHDGAIISALKSGDQNALNAIDRRWGTDIRRSYSAIGNDPILIDQAVNDALWYVWKHPESYHPGPNTSVAKWFRGICRTMLRRAISAHAREKAGFETMLHEIDWYGRREPHSGGASQLPCMRDAVRRAVAALPLRQRAIIEMDLAHSCLRAPSYEIARELGISRDSVRTLRWRAHRRIRTQLATWAPEWKDRS